MPYINKINVGGVLYDVQDLEASTAVPQIKQMISNVESSPATAAHAAGSYLIYNNTLYRASADIAVGDTLTVGTNIAAVSGGLAGDVADLKSALDFRTQNIIYHESKNLANPNEYEDNKIHADGTTTESTTVIHTGFIDVSEGQKIRIAAYNGESLTTGITTSAFAAYDSEKTIMPSAGKEPASPTSVYEVPEGVKYIKCNLAKTYTVSPWSIMIAVADTVSDFPAWEPYFEPYFSYDDDFLKSSTKTEIANIQSAMPGLIQSKDTFDSLGISIGSDSDNKLNPNALTDGRMETDGSVTSSESVCYSDYIAVTQGDEVRGVYFGADGETSPVAITFSRITAFDSSKNVMESAGVNNSSQIYTKYTVPDGVAYIRYSFAKVYLPYLMVTINIAVSDTTWEAYPAAQVTSTYDLITEATKQKIEQAEENNNNCFVATAASMAEGSNVVLAAPDSIKNFTVSFAGDITTLGKLYIGVGKGVAAAGGFIVIDDTKLTVRNNGSTGGDGNLTAEYNHGITNMVGKINVNLHVKSIGKADVIISVSGTDELQGGVFVQTDITWFGSLGSGLYSPFAGRITAETSDSGSYTNCELRYYAGDIMKDIWAFGDSYFVGGWCKYAEENGYRNAMFDAVPGRNSAAAYHILEMLLEKRTPKKILWCMGMNDADSGAVNTSWNTCYTNLKTVCESKNIELILCTIPNVPTIDNTYKNAIIKSSGYRYVDIANAMGAENAGATWYAGLLETTTPRVHPTVPLGYKTVAARFIASVPELMDD